MDCGSVPEKRCSTAVSERRPLAKWESSSAVILMPDEGRVRPPLASGHLCAIAIRGGHAVAGGTRSKNCGRGPSRPSRMLERFGLACREAVQNPHARPYSLHVEPSR
jgi:hypothetical protein